MTSESDGRHARSERTRAAVLHSFAALVATEGSRPTMEAVADEAEISVRSVFRHFADVDAVIVAALAYVLEVELTDRVVIAPGGPVRQRVSAVAASRSEDNESMMMLFGLAASIGVGDPEVEASLARSRAAGRRWLSDAFSRELARRSGAARGALLDTIEAALSPATWYGIRIDQAVSTVRGQRIVEAMLLGALTTTR